MVWRHAGDNPHSRQRNPEYATKANIRNILMLRQLRPPASQLGIALRQTWARQACNRMHVRTGSHLQRELLAAEDDEALLALIRRAARQQRFDPPSIVVAIQRVSHLIERPSSHSGGSSDGSDACQALEDAMLLQLPQFSVEQAASALASLRHLAPSDATRASLLSSVAQQSTSQVLHEASTEHVVSLLSAFAQLSGRAGSVSFVVDDFLARLTAELHMRVFDGPVLHLTPLADAQIPTASWAVASVYAPAALRAQWHTRSLTSLQDFAAPAQAAANVQHPQAAAQQATSQGTEARLSSPVPSNGNGGADTASLTAAEAQARPPDDTQQSRVAELMDALALRARMHLMNRHSAKATFNPSDLAALAGSFALLGHYSGDVSQALDAMLGFARRRIDARHLNAVSRLDHTAQLLWSVAMLQHRTVATQELLRASSSERCEVRPAAGTYKLQVAHQMASEAAASTVRGGGAGRSAPVTQPDNDESDTANLTAILSAHWHLGYRPSEKLLVAMGPFVCRRAAQLTQQQKTDMAHLLLEFQFDPGDTVLQLLHGSAAA